MSLRSKFLALMVIIPSISLLLFLYFAYTTFISDKRTYLFEKQFEQLNITSLFLNAPDLQAFHEYIKKLVVQEGFDSLVVTDDKGVIVDCSNADKIGQPIQTIIGKAGFEKLGAQQASEGSIEAIDDSGESKLISFLKTSVVGKDYLLLLTTPFARATRASSLFLLRSISAFAILFSTAVLVSILFSNQLTRGIQQLSFAMSEFGNGNFTAPLPFGANDEVGQMTKQFAAMRTQIQSLIAEKEVKTRIETEMKLAGQLQSRFFPQIQATFGRSELAAFFEPASDAGGDWWFYFEKNGKLVFLIGDATGHGINSAMLTAVSRSAMSLIEERFTTTSEGLRLLNRAIYDSAKNELNMTCALLSLDLANGVLSYSIAAHEAPFVVPARLGITMKEIRPVDAAPSRRLGEVPENTYEEHSIQLYQGDCLFLYSDGLVDLVSPTNEIYSERRLRRTLASVAGPQQSAREIVGIVKKAVEQHRQKAELMDDLSFLAVTWRA